MQKRTRKRERKEKTDTKIDFNVQSHQKVTATMCCAIHSRNYNGSQIAIYGISLLFPSLSLAHSPHSLHSNFLFPVFGC